MVDDSDRTEHARPTAALPPALKPALELPTRKPDDLFDYAHTGFSRGTPERPGWVGGMLRGTEYKPVFAEGSNWFTDGMSDAGNWVLDEINNVGSDLIHHDFGAGTEVPLTDELILGFTAGARKIREDEIPVSDQRRIAIEKLRRNHPGALPVWVEGSFGQNLSFSIGHNVALGPGGAMARFGFSAAEGLDLTMQRLVFFGGSSRDIAKEDVQLKRLGLSPLLAAEVAEMETGARFELVGHANFRLDAALGLGYSVPALNNVVRVGTSVELGAYATLDGQFQLLIQKRDEGRARITLTSMGTRSVGAQLKVLAGVEVNHKEVSRMMRGFVDWCANGGDANAWRNQMSNERERELARDMSGYLRLLAKNIADGATREVLDYLVTRYAAAYLEIRGGVDIASNFKTEVDFDLDSDRRLMLPRADMVPVSMRGRAAADQPLEVRAGDVARLAYDMALRGDLRLVQHLTLIRSSGVRVNERETRESTGTSSSVEFQIPFIEYKQAKSSTHTVVNHFLPELGRTRTAIWEFNRDYGGIFGNTETSTAEVRVHTPDGKSKAQVFFGSDENFSADFVVQNLVEPWTNFEEMQNLVSVLDVISQGRLAERASEALSLGKYRDDNLGDDINVIHQLFFKPREYGRTVAHLHIWLGEEGIRHLLGAKLTDDELYAAIGEVFANLDPKGGKKLPAWARPGADRDAAVRARRLRGSTAHLVGRYDHDLNTAHYLVDNIVRLRSLVGDARTPAQEERAAAEIRDFIRDAKDKLPAYAALASLVPENHRAVEMRLAAVRTGEPPIRFTYIQDGRTSDILWATGYARAAMQQYRRFHAIVDPETRLRVNNVITEVHEILNAPSPDPYRLKVAMRALEAEMVFLDRRAGELYVRIEEDLALGRVFLEGLPEARLIQAVLPGPRGRELATVKLNAQRYISVTEPDVRLLRATFQALLGELPSYRRIEAVAPLIESTALLANELAGSHESVARQARAAVDDVRAVIRDDGPDSDLNAAVDRLASVHTRLLAFAGDAVGGSSGIEEGAPRTAPAPLVVGIPKDFAADRKASADSFRSLIGNPEVAPVSYFERTGVVPRHYMGTPYASGGDGIVTGSMLREADLMMAASRPSGDLGLPPLAQENVTTLLSRARAADAKGFLDTVDSLSFRPEQVLQQSERRVLEYLLADIAHDQRTIFLRRVSPDRADNVERIWSELAAARQRPEFRKDLYDRERQDFLREHPRFDEQLNFMKDELAEDPEQFEIVLDTLGYGQVLDKWHTHATARLELVLSQISGDELNDLVSKMGNKERRRFLMLLSRSDLKPQTRAKLAGQVVDDNFFWRQDEQVVEALVTGMNGADLRIFFDQLHTDGKLEDFLRPESFWSFLFSIMTFGLARLFLHENEAALRVVVAQGWSVDELMLEYGAKPKHLARMEDSAERVLFDATVDTIPMDPQIRGGVRVLHGIIGNVKYYDFAQLPREGAEVLKEMAKGAARQLGRRVGDIAKQGGSINEIVGEYQRFLSGLSPGAVAEQLDTGDTDGSAALVSKALVDGAVAGLVKAAMDPSNKFITMDLVRNILHATNDIDSPVHFEEDSFDLRVEQRDYDALVEKAAFFSKYTGFDFGQVEMLYGGFAVGAGAVVMGPTISIAKERAPMVDGKIQIDDNMQQVVAFHATAHVLQQQMYGVRTNAFIDQAFHIGAGNSRNAAYTVTEDMFDQARSIHDFKEHWEQQAELLEQSLRLLWSRRQSMGDNLAAIESYPGPGNVLRVSGGNIALDTPEKWNKMVTFVREFGQAARGGMARSKGNWEWRGARDYF